MTLSEARAALALAVAATEDPALSNDELDTILREFAVVDDEGRPPIDAEWGGAYDMPNAEAKAFRIKAARCRRKVDFSADSARVSLSQRAKAFDEAAELALKRAAVSF